MIKLKYLGIEEEISISNKQVLEYINNQDFKTRLEFAIETNIDSHNIADQLIMLAAYTNKLLSQDLNPAQINALKGFLQNKLNDLP